MNRTKQILSTTAGISFLILLFWLALFLPKYINAFLDEKTLNHVTTRNISMKTYELSYTSFYEKLYAIACCDKETIHVVPVQETGQWMESDKITEIIQKELDILAERNWLLDGIILKPDKLTSAKAFTLYSSGERKYLKGITFWKVTYRQKKGTYVVYMDEEYHKIYTVQVTRKEKRFSEADPVVYEKAMAETTGYGITDDTAKAKTGMPETLYEWIEVNLRYYYGLEHTGIYYYPEGSLFGYCNAVFEDGSLLQLGYQCKITRRKNKNILQGVFGIYLEEMLQF